MKLDVSSLAHTKWECKYHMKIEQQIGICEGNFDKVFE